MSFILYALLILQTFKSAQSVYFSTNDSSEVPAPPLFLVQSLYISDEDLLFSDSKTSAYWLLINLSFLTYVFQNNPVI